MYIELIIVILIILGLVFIFKYSEALDFELRSKSFGSATPNLAFYYDPILNINGYNKSKFTLYENAEFRGINMLGVNTSDGVIPVGDISECQRKCGDYVECKGFSYWPTAPETGNCYLFSSGDIIPSCQGFKAGKKIDSCLE